MSSEVEPEADANGREAEIKTASDTDLEGESRVDRDGRPRVHAVVA